MSTVITQEQAASMVKRLEDLGTRLENSGSPDWFVVAQAAAIIQSLRHGLYTVESPVWIGVDMAAGQDQTVRSEIHVH